jgi:hypothetical protein
MKKGATWAAKCARTKASVVMVTADQLDRKLASAQPYSPLWTLPCQWHGITIMAWLYQTIRQSNMASPFKRLDIPQPDPRSPPALYTDVPMEDVREYR